MLFVEVETLRGACKRENLALGRMHRYLLLFRGQPRQSKRVWGQKTQRAESLPDVGRDSLGSELEPLRRDLGR